jgi:cell division protein FtsN
MKQRQSGNTLIGLIIGLVFGLGIALGIAVYVTKVPIPFMAKTQRNGPEQDEVEARKNRDWDPNGPLLAGKPAQRPAAEPPAPNASRPAPAAGTGANNNPASAPTPVEVAPASPSRATPTPVETNPAPSADPLGDLVRARSGIRVDPSPKPSANTGADADPFIYFVQAGAFRNSDEAESQRARLSLMGVEAKVTEREQAGRPVYRVRAGPFEKKEDADRLKGRLESGGLETMMVRVQR